jgi:hypothetical protein
MLLPLGLIVVRLQRIGRLLERNEATARISSHDYELWIFIWFPGILDTPLRLAERFICNPYGAKLPLRWVLPRDRQKNVGG